MNSIYEIFLEYGWAGMNAVIVCIILIYGGKYIIKKMTSNVRTGLEEVGSKLTDNMAEQNNKIVDQINSQNKELVKTIIDQQDKILNHVLETKKNAEDNHTTMLGERMALTEEIKNSLKDIGQIHNCQRVFVLEFHNSYQNLSGTPFAKFSCTYEWCDKGYMSLQFGIKDLQFSALSRPVTKMYQSNNKQLVYYDINEFVDDCPALKKLCDEFPFETMVCTPMYDRNNIMIGALVLEYGYKPPTINLNQLHIQAAELTSMINIRYKYLN